MTVSLFFENSRMTNFVPNWAKFDPNLGILVVKILNFFPFLFTKIEKKIISGKKSTFYLFHSLHDLPLPTQILFIFCFFPKIAKKNILGEKLCHFVLEMGHSCRTQHVGLFYFAMLLSSKSEWLTSVNSN